MSALSEGHLAAVIFCVLGDPLLFCWEDFFSFFIFFPLFYPPFSFFFADFWSIGQGNPSFGGWSYIWPGLKSGLPLEKIGQFLEVWVFPETNAGLCVHGPHKTAGHLQNTPGTPAMYFPLVAAGSQSALY